MPKVKVNHISSLDPQECFNKIKKLFESDKDLQRLDGNFTCDFDEENLCGDAKSKQFKAYMEINDHSEGSEVELIINLPLHLALAKGVVKTMLTKKLQKYVG